MIPLIVFIRIDLKMSVHRCSQIISFERIREIPASSVMIHMTADRLRFTLQSIPNDMPPANIRPFPHDRLNIFVGMEVNRVRSAGWMRFLQCFQEPLRPFDLFFHAKARQKHVSHLHSIEHPVHTGGNLSGWVARWLTMMMFSEKWLVCCSHPGMIIQAPSSS